MKSILELNMFDLTKDEIIELDKLGWKFDIVSSKYTKYNIPKVPIEKIFSQDCPFEQFRLYVDNLELNLEQPLPSEPTFKVYYKVFYGYSFKKTLVDNQFHKFEYLWNNNKINKSPDDIKDIVKALQFTIGRSAKKSVAHLIMDFLRKNKIIE